MLYKLTNNYLNNHILDFLCSDFCSANNLLKNIIYSPETFTVHDKQSQQDLIFFDDVPYDTWIRGMVQSILNEIVLHNDYQATYSNVIGNLKTLLEYEYSGKKLANQIYNQEFIDVIRRVVAFTLYNDVNHEIDTAKIFNDFANKIMPLVIELVEQDKEIFTDEMLLKLSIASGLSGLDLKGAPAAASKYSNSGIPMKQYLTVDLHLAATDYLEKLRTTLKQCTFPAFHYDEFVKSLFVSKKIVWFTDDYIETYFDLCVIKRILKNFDVSVEIIPKNGTHGNDISWQGLEKIIQLPIFKELNHAISQGRFLINRNGPRMGAMNLQKLSKKAITSVEEADFCVLKGCRIFEMVQGFLKKKAFCSFIVARHLSEITSGFDSLKYPIVFLSLQPYEYGYFGVYKQNAREKIFDGGRKLMVSMNTISDHIKRINMDDPIQLIDSFNYLKNQLNDYIGDKRPVYQEMDMIAEKLVYLTKKTYDQMCISYQELRLDEPHDLDKKMWNMLSHYIKRNIAERPVKLLDVGTGSGRDIMFATKLGYHTIGIDNSDGFIDILRRLEQEGKILKGSYKKCDMRMLDFPDNSFDVVRQNASILHLPLIGPGYMADKAISEAYRVLKIKGLIYIFVKKGSSLAFMDTNEGLGGRVFQFYSKSTIKNLVERNGFSILSITEEVEERKNGNVNWIAVIAQKSSHNVDGFN